ncbi:aromatic ring-hydroxylating dioxygenase subunit alpha [Pusillimonas sp. CC-YST705]|uniref:Aromatic ring-hydroxylating dioxygenase subunit alpha n=1 Tax=Mesopusillimonas faecipullorum TaxID=2755040 RepID=A0ABS8CBA3_9BURK|nr:aromatic ring-hydroxylating dioxygenase subunit alpha [Mesopusillimonas faecipullorum]MCB5363316.1 aromatic ring-hydroxylating dioxygenase subunit alpha [Mesopusillimonas faecipullorum]
MFIKNAWYMAAWRHEIGAQPFARTLCNTPLVFFAHPDSGQVSALLDRCCHRAAPLRFGQVVPQGLECGYHGMVFDAQGACVRIPGQERIPASAKVRAYPVAVKDEIVWVWMGEPELADPALIVDYPYHNDHARWPHKHQVYRVQANYMLLVDNLMDLTHLAFVHRSTIGGNPKAHVEAKMKVTPREDGLHFIRWLMDTTPPPTYRKAVDIGERIDRWMEFQYIAPGTVLQWTGGIESGRNAMQNRDQPGFSLRIFHGLTPETDTSCFYFWSAANGYRQDDPQATVDLFQEIDTAFKEDKAIVEAQQHSLCTQGEQGLVDIVSDAARIHMRRTVKRLAEAEHTQSRQ